MGTTVGVFIPLAFWQLVLAGIACIAVIWRSGFVSLGSLTLVTALPVFLLVYGKWKLLPLALVVMALVTSMLSGPLMERMLARRKPARFVRYLRDRGFFILGSDKDPFQAIEAVAGGLSTALDSSLETLLEAIRRRDRLTGNGLAPGVRLAHARLSGISAPLVGVALCPEGFRSGGDAEKVRAVVVVLTPQDKEAQQIEILTDLARTFLDARLRRLLLACSSALEMRALLRSSQSEPQH